MNANSTEHARLATLTPAQYAAELNAQAREWLVVNPGGWASMLSEESGEYSEYANGLEMAFDFACSEYSDSYKSEHNFRPRTRFESLAHVEAALADLYEMAERCRVWEAEEIEELRAEREVEEAAADHAAHVEAVLAPVTRWMDKAATLGACGW